MSRPTYIVVGGGISGLAAAWELSGYGGSPSPRVVVLEGSDRLGGKIASVDFDGSRIEAGPDAFLARVPHAVDLCAELGLADELVSPATTKAYVWSRGSLRTIQSPSIMGIPTTARAMARTDAISVRGRLRAELDLILPRTRHPGDNADRSVHEALAARFGREFAESVAGALVGGIHAGDPTQLSLAATAVQIDAAGRTHRSLMRGLKAQGRAALLNSQGPATLGSEASLPPNGPGQPPVFLAPKAGMIALVERLTERLEHRGVEIRTGAPVEGLARQGHSWVPVLHARPPLAPGLAGAGLAGAGLTSADPIGARPTSADPIGADPIGSGPIGADLGADCLVADGLIIATPARDAALLLEAHFPRAATKLAGVDHASVALVNLCWPSRAVARPLDASGFLVPATSGRLMTACTWTSTKWPHRARPDHVVMRVSVGRFGDDRALAMTDEALAEVLQNELVEAGVLQPGAPGPTTCVVVRWPDAFPQYNVGHPEQVRSIEAEVGGAGNLVLAGAALRGVGIPACIDSGRRAGRTLLEYSAKSRRAGNQSAKLRSGNGP